MGIITFSYYPTIIYNFHVGQRFSGNRFHNPYENWNNQNLIKANFHAHSIAWKGLTNGHQSSEELKKHYIKNNYDVASISNYHDISLGKSELIEIPAYEHGLNIRKSHKLAINPKKVVYHDFLLWQNLSQKQQVIDELKKHGALVALAHPNFCDGHSMEDMQYLANYEFVEVLNHYRYSFDKWDRALLSGKRVWLMANDDSHDIYQEPTCQLYNLIDSKNIRSSEAILTNLSQGNFVAMEDKNGQNDLELLNISVDKNILQFEFKGSDCEIEVICDGRMVKKINSHYGSYIIQEKDSYVRLVAKSEFGNLYMNPITRINVWTETSSINLSQTIMYRICVLLVSGSILMLIAYPGKLKKLISNLTLSRILKRTKIQ